jgi:D-glycero-alpha-D-manno-heptose 1-phosphate guanylyltransferase
MMSTESGLAAVILAGGLGLRLRAAVPDLPKPMAPLNGRPFLAHLMDYWLGQGVVRFILSVGYRHKAIIGFFGAAYRGAALDYAVEETPLGTGGGLLLALEQMPGEAPFLALNGDTFFAVDASALRRFHAQSAAGCTLALFRADEADRYMGVRLAPDGRVEDLAAGRGAPGALANGGVYVFNPAMLRERGFVAGEKISLEETLLPSLKDAGDRIFGMACPGRFIDIGVPADYARARDILP